MAKQTTVKRSQGEKVLNLVGQVSALNEFGDGVIKHREQVVKIARTLPGDTVEYSIPAVSPRYVYGILQKLKHQSPDRVESQCAAFDSGCGGCQWLHFNYSKQVLWKTRLVRELLVQRCQQDVKVNQCIAADKLEGFRNKISLKNVNGKLFFMQEFNDLAVSPSRCRVESEANQDIWRWLRSKKIPTEIEQIHVRSNHAQQLGIHFFVRSFNQNLKDFADNIRSHNPSVVGIGASLRDDYRIVAGKEFLTEVCGDLQFQIPLNGFFQTNAQQSKILLDLVVKSLKLGRAQTVLDLYSGVGFFSIALAQHCAKVVGIENNPGSVAAAVKNAALNQTNNCSFICDDVANGLKRFALAEFDSIVLDPPRSGCQEELLSELVRLHAEQIVYVSCSPSSLARDLKVLLKAGYRIGYCQPVDMFPHSSHVETIVRLSR